MASVNKTILIGNLGQDPDVRYFPSGKAVVNIGLATTRKWRDKATGEWKEATDWHRLVVWGRAAEILGEYGSKGKEIYLEGENRTRSYDKHGYTFYVTEVHTKHIQFTGARSANTPTAPQGDVPPLEDHDFTDQADD